MKHKIFLGMVVATLALTSCKKFLEADSPSDFTTATIFSNEVDAQMAISGIYSQFNADAYTSRVSNNFSGNTDVEVGGVGSAPDNSRRDIWSFEATDANADLRTVWNQAYKAINLANEAIEGINSSSVKSKNMRHMLGEALTLRAYWYYLLVNHWGDVPYKTTATRAGDDFYQGRTGRDTILSGLIDDLIAIEPEMMWASQLDYGIERINREFVIGMISRLSLMRGGYWLYPDMVMRRKDDYRKFYEIANTYAKKLVSLRPHTLGDFKQVFLNEVQYIVPKNDGDVLYEVAFQPGAGDVAWCNGVRVDAGTHKYGSGSNYLSFPATYFHSFDTTDLRLPVTCALYYYDKDLLQNPAGAASIAPGKWSRKDMTTQLGETTSKGTGINWPLMRYADVLLMLAESENELNGPNAEAQAALKEVRNRAFTAAQRAEKVEAYVANVSGSKDAFFNAIVNERAWEFGGECLRKFDLARWNLYGKKIAETKSKLTQWGAEAYANTGSLPATMAYVKNNDGTITFLNKHTKDYTAPSTGTYFTVSWLSSMYNSTTNAPADYIVRQWRGYKDASGQAAVRYILPVHNDVVTSSRNAVFNTGMYGY